MRTWALILHALIWTASAVLADVPPGATALGFTKCVINEHPSAADIAPGNNGNRTWFSGQWYAQAPSLDHYSTQGGVLALTLGGDLVSTPRDFSAGKLPLLPGTNGFYVEFDVRLSDNDPDHFPAVWLMPAEHNGAQQDHHDGDAAGFERWMELDIDEGGFGPGLTGTVHNWTGVYPDYQHVQNPNNVSSVAIDRSKKHTFGACFDPGKQTVTWWLDGVRQMTAGPPHVPAIAARQHFYLIMSAQSHGKNKAYSMFVSAVRAYTSPTSALPEVNSRKPAETVEGDASPRGIAAGVAAKLQVAGIFADGMVIQRGVIAPVWGWGPPERRSPWNSPGRGSREWLPGMVDGV